MTKPQKIYLAASLLASHCLGQDLTKTLNVWEEPQLIKKYIAFHRPDFATPSWLAWRTDSDPDPLEWQAIAPDYANDGNFFVLFYDNKTLSDIIKVGTKNGLRNHTSIGGDIPTADTTLCIHDVWYPDWRSNYVTEAKQTVNIYSQHNGITMVSAADYADELSIFRPGMGGAWINLGQGSRLRDWRIGMIPGTYDIGIYAAGGRPVSAREPGTLIMRITQSGSVYWASAPQVDALAARVRQLECEVQQLKMKQNTK